MWTSARSRTTPARSGPSWRRSKRGWRSRRWSAWSRPTRTGTAPPRRGARWSRPGAGMLACADVEEAAALQAGRARGPDPRVRRAQPRRRRRRLRVRPDADHLDARGSPPAAGRRRAPGRPAPLSPRDRHRHEPPRLPPRQPGAHACPRCSPSPNLDIEGVYTHFATADAPGDELFALQRRNFDAANGRWPASGHGTTSGTPRTARRCSPNRPRGSTWCARACSCTASLRRPSRAGSP